jgi:serine/threonine protein kinase/tetratricopeptide (TPR) repeat protein
MNHPTPPAPPDLSANAETRTGLNLRPASDSPLLHDGQLFGPYRIARLVGRGGVGEVYKALDARLGRYVALKVLHDQITQGYEGDWVLREARACAALQHPHICVVHDIGIEDGRQYIVFEFLEGENLAERVHRGAMPADAVIATALQLADALASAHAAGIVHRDLKPHNIMLVPDGCKVVDFGLAAVVHSAESISVMTTRTDLSGGAMGTVPYMAPERLLGRAAGASGDVFALGAILYEMLSGQRAFDGPTYASIVGSILHREPDPSLLKISGTPARLKSVVHDCLNKDSARRPTAVEVLHRLEDLRSPSRARSRATPVGDDRIVTLAVLPFSGISDAISTSATELFSSAIERLRTVRVVRMPTCDSSTKPSMKKIAADLRVNRVLVGDVRRGVDHTVVDIRLLDPIAEEQLYARSFVHRDGDWLPTVAAIANALVPELGGVLKTEVRGSRRKRVAPVVQELYLKGRHLWNKRTNESIECAISLFQEAIDLDVLWALPHAGLADCHTAIAIAGWRDVSSAYERARASAYRALELDPTLAEPHATLGVVYGLSDWNWHAAQKEFETSIALNPSYGPAYLWYGKHLMLLGKHDAALQNLNIAWRLDPLSRSVQLLMGQAWFVARKYDIATAHFEALQHENPSWVLALYSLGIAHLYSGRLDEAKMTFDAAVRADPQTRHSLVGLAEAHWKAGEEAKARDVFERLVSPKTPGSLSSCDVAEVLATFGDERGCVEWLRKAVDEGCSDLVGLRLDPAYDAVRENADFRAIVDLIFGDA